MKKHIEMHLTSLSGRSLEYDTLVQIQCINEIRNTFNGENDIEKWKSNTWRKVEQQFDRLEIYTRKKPSSDKVFRLMYVIHRTFHYGNDFFKEWDDVNFIKEKLDSFFELRNA